MFLLLKRMAPSLVIGILNARNTAANPLDMPWYPPNQVALLSMLYTYYVEATKLSKLNSFSDIKFDSKPKIETSYKFLYKSASSYMF